MASHRPIRVFVTGTDTGVGKTLVSALLLRAFPYAGYFKPIQTGDDDDCSTVSRMAHASSGDRIQPPVYRFALPAAPSRAAAAEGQTIDPRTIVDRWHQVAARRESWIVEGAGGLLVPINERETIADLAAALKLPLLIVSSTRLGTINHTLLTLEVVRARGLPVRGVILNGAPDPGLPSLKAVIESLGGVPVLAEIAALQALDDTALDQAAKILENLA